MKGRLSIYELYDFYLFFVLSGSGLDVIVSFHDRLGHKLSLPCLVRSCLAALIFDRIATSGLAELFAVLAGVGLGLGSEAFWESAVALASAVASLVIPIPPALLDGLHHVFLELHPRGDQPLCPYRHC